jgi:hypothetical protein
MDSHFELFCVGRRCDGAWYAIWRPNLVVNYITKVKNGVNYLSEN